MALGDMLGSIGGSLVRRVRVGTRFTPEVSFEPWATETGGARASGDPFLLTLLRAIGLYIVLETPAGDVPIKVSEIARKVG